MVRKPSPEMFISEDLAKLLKKVGPENKISEWIDDMEEVLRENMYAGEPIRKARFPNNTLTAMP